MSDKVKEELKKIIMKSISDNAEKQHQEQIEEVFVVLVLQKHFLKLTDD